MIKLQYRIATGRKLNLINPLRFTEKLQWYKLNYRHPLMVKCADKFGVREYVAEKGLDNILVPLYGVYNNASEIDWSVLPKSFVLKTTNGSHTNIFVKDKMSVDVHEIKENLNRWLYKRSEKLGREWAYYNIVPRVICEKYLDNDENNDLVDYKFFCFNGEPFFLYVISERDLNGKYKLGIYDIEFNQLNYARTDVENLTSFRTKPKNFELMIEIARTLSKDFPHVRVDMYNINGSILFGELTFYSGSGYMRFNPDDFDLIVGDKFILPDRLSQ